MIEHFVFTSIDEISFDQLFADSLAALDSGTYPWPDGVSTEQEKKDYFRSIIETVLTFDNCLCIKSVDSGTKNTSAIIGTVIDGKMYGAISLLSPDLSGSKAYVYDSAVRDNLKSVMSANGALEMVGFMPPSSPLKGGVSQRHNLSSADYHARENDTSIQPVFDTDTFTIYGQQG